ncbi:MAG: ComF family protein [Candidatus Binatia bacterium]
MLLRGALGRGFRGVLALLYPPSCYLCSAAVENGRFVCARCWGKVTRVSAPICAICGAPGHLQLCPTCQHQERGFDFARSFGIYDGVLAKLVQGLKYEGERALTHELTGCLKRYLNETPFDFEAITYVPMGRAALRERGFNQAEQLARELGRSLRVDVIPALRKIRETPPQTGLSLNARRENLRSAFAPDGPVHCAEILLIDDVYTTGSTVDACGRALKRGGYRGVYVLTVARAVRVEDHTADDPFDLPDRPSPSR